MTTKPYTYEEIKKWGLLGWISHLADIFLNPSDENDEYICGKLLDSTGGDYRRLGFQLNERLKGEYEPKKLRPVLRKGEIYNKYILKKYEEYKAISEEIDAPSICEDLEQAAESYIECGEVYYKEKKKIPVRDAIQGFIESN